MNVSTMRSLSLSLSLSLFLFLSLSLMFNLDEWQGCDSELLHVPTQVEVELLGSRRCCARCVRHDNEVPHGQVRVELLRAPITVRVSHYDTLTVICLLYTSPSPRDH